MKIGDMVYTWDYHEDLPLLGLGQKRSVITIRIYKIISLDDKTAVIMSDGLFGQSIKTISLCYLSESLAGIMEKLTQRTATLKQSFIIRYNK